MLFLRLQVLQHRVELARADRKGPVPTLPEKTVIARLKSLYPFRGCFLYLLNHLGLGKSSRQGRDDVNVIGNTVHAQGLATQTAADRRQIGVHARAYRGVEPGLTIFRARDDVKDDFTERLRHEPMMDRKGAEMNRAFSAGGLALDESLGRCPRLPYERCAFGAKQILRASAIMQNGVHGLAAASPSEKVT